MKIKNEFEEVGKNIAEKQKMYIENARKSGTAGPAGKAKARKVDPNDPSMERKPDPEAEPAASQWKEYDEVNIEGDIIRERQEDINQIERLMYEVNQMTNDMATEVANADAKLDQIGQNARSTKDNTRKAAVEIAKGAEYQSKSYKRMYDFSLVGTRGVN